MQSNLLFLVLIKISVLLTAVSFLDVVKSASIYAPDFNQSSAHFLDQQRSCRDLCSFCPTCNGFYCGEECICECSQEPSEHAKCIDLVKANSEKLGLVYDVVLQQPEQRSSRTRFGRRAAANPEENDALGDTGGFRKILFANFDSSRSGKPFERKSGGDKVKKVEKKAQDTTTKQARKDPLGKSDFMDLLFKSVT